MHTSIMPRKQAPGIEVSTTFHSLAPKGEGGVRGYDDSASHRRSPTSTFSPMGRRFEMRASLKRFLPIRRGRRQPGVGSSSGPSRYGPGGVQIRSPRWRARPPGTRSTQTHRRRTELHHAGRRIGRLELHGQEIEHRALPRIDLLALAGRDPLEPQRRRRGGTAACRLRRKASRTDRADTGAFLRGHSTSHLNGGILQMGRNDRQVSSSRATNSATAWTLLPAHFKLCVSS